MTGTFEAQDGFEKCNFGSTEALMHAMRRRRLSFWIENIFRQRRKLYTIKNPVRFTGVGLHSGERVTVSVYPPVSTLDFDGILFRTSTASIPASYENVSDTNYCTTLSSSKAAGSSIQTVEHLLAAFYIVGIQSAVVEVDGSQELPILDGSCKPYCDALLNNIAPVQTPHENMLKTLKIMQPITVHSGDSHATFLPKEELSGDCDSKLSVFVDVDFENFSLPRSQIQVEENNFLTDVSSARTFTFKRVLPALKKSGLIKGGSLENAIVYDDSGVPLNAEPLRFENEFARHKILDCVGDLSLIGGSNSPHGNIHKIEGTYKVYRPGHSINFKMVKKLMGILKEEESLGVPLSSRKLIVA